MRFLGSLFFLSALTFSAFAQSSDSVVVATGRIINASTKEPVTAKIYYQSLPYGNIVGSLHTDNYMFPLYDNAKYAIIVEAIGFETAKYMIDPAEANTARQVVKDIELSTGSAIDTHVPGHVIRLNNLIFELGKSKISPESNGELERVWNMMNENSTMVIQLEGHTDYQGNAKDNMKLSKERVDAVKKYLVGKGIPASRIKTKAFGGTMPISKDDTPDAHRLNRRVELRILSK